MAVSILTSSASGSFLSQPDSAGEKLILRSSDAGDTMNCVIVGLVGGVSTSETIALTGTTAVETTNTFTSITQAYLASAPTGQVDILRQGQKATGYSSAASNPADGATITVGGVVYTFKTPEVSTITTVADVADATTDLYIDAQDKNGTVRIWNNNGGVGTPPATPGGGRLLAVLHATGDSADTRAATFASTINADAQFEASASGNVVTIYDAALGDRTDIAVGTSTDAVAKVTDGAANNVANRVRRGIDLYLTAKSLASAVLLTGTGGDNWGTGTVINPIYNAYDDGGFLTQSWNGTSEAVLYWRDKLAVNRNGSFPISDDTAAIDTVSPTGGSDGTIIVTFYPSSYQVTTSMTFNSPALASTTLLAATTPTTDAVHVKGKGCTLHLRTANLTSAVVAHVETAETSAGPWADRSAAFAITNMDNNEQFLTITEHAEWVRVKIDTNANTTDSAVHMALIF